MRATGCLLGMVVAVPVVTVVTETIVTETVVNEAVRLGPRQPRPLANGDRLRLGETTLHFLIG